MQFFNYSVINVSAADKCTVCYHSFNNRDSVYSHEGEQGELHLMHKNCAVTSNAFCPVCQKIVDEALLRVAADQESKGVRPFLHKAKREGEELLFNPNHPFTKGLRVCLAAIIIIGTLYCTYDNIVRP